MSLPCDRLHQAYVAMRDGADKARFVALMEAFEADVKAGAYAFEPVRDAERKPSDGEPLQWNCVDTPKGRVLTLFTSREEVEKHPAPASVGVKLSAFLRVALADGKIVGIVINPMDGRHGVLVDRRNLESLGVRTGLLGRTKVGIHPALVEQAYMGLFKVAVGVPTPVYDIQRDLQALGGAEKLVKPILDRWSAALKKGTEKLSEPREGVMAVLSDVLAASFVAGSFVRKDPALALKADPGDCLDRVPDLKSDIEQNLNEFLVILFGFIRLHAPTVTEDQMWVIALENVGLLGFGVMCFGIGWGIARYVAGLEEYELIALQKHEAEFLENLERQRAAAAEKAPRRTEQPLDQEEK